MEVCLDLWPVCERRARLNMHMLEQCVCPRSAGRVWATPRIEALQCVARAMLQHGERRKTGSMLSRSLSPSRFASWRIDVPLSPKQTAGQMLQSRC
jgi:hypothetical protein